MPGWCFDSRMQYLPCWFEADGLVCCPGGTNQVLFTALHWQKSPASKLLQEDIQSLRFSKLCCFYLYCMFCFVFFFLIQSLNGDARTFLTYPIACGIRTGSLLSFLLLHYMHLITQPKLIESISDIPKNIPLRHLPSRYNLVVVLIAYILTQYLQECNLCTEEPSTCSQSHKNHE